MTKANHPINPLQCDGFPSRETILENNDLRGLTKREYFAGLAMQGLLFNYRDNGLYGDSYSYPMVEEIAVRCADALIAELNKEEKP